MYASVGLSVAARRLRRREGCLQGKVAALKKAPRLQVGSQSRCNVHETIRPFFCVRPHLSPYRTVRGLTDFLVGRESRLA